MLSLPRSLAAWPAEGFSATLQQELAPLACGELPLQQALAHSSSVLETTPEVMVIGSGEDACAIRVRIGIFFQGIVGGCSCADDPSPLETNNEYCEMELVIDKATAATTFSLLAAGDNQ